jgi:hypothetical protein
MYIIDGSKWLALTLGAYCSAIPNQLKQTNHSLVANGPQSELLPDSKIHSKGS